MGKLGVDAQVEQSLEVAEAKPKLQEPKKYNVLLVNDDYTPMEFVVRILKQFFHQPEEIAIQVMMKVHVEGKAVCGVYTRDIAETKVVLVNEYAKMNEHPLLCCMEQN
jgi:ATP-dependent Clp protease adaptor protein ClpS